MTALRPDHRTVAFESDARRVLARPFVPGDWGSATGMSRLTAVIERVLAIPDDLVTDVLDDVRGDVDGDGRAEIVAGLGRGGAGWLEGLEDANGGFAPGRGPPVSWAAYNQDGGETPPAGGNVDADDDDEIVVDKASADKAGYQPGDVATVLSKGAPRQFTIARPLVSAWLGSSSRARQPKGSNTGTKIAAARTAATNGCRFAASVPSRELPHKR